MAPGSEIVHFNLGSVYLRMGKVKKAIEEYLTCTRLAPDFVHPYVMLYKIYQRMGKTEMAERVKRKVMKMRKNGREIFSFLERKRRKKIHG